jgi:hypothetical protein
MSASNYLETLLLGELETILEADGYVALFTADPGETGASGEVSGGDYARIAIGNVTVTGGSLANDAAVEFAEASAGWGAITHFGLFDADTAGNFLAGGQLTAPKTVLTGDSVKFAIGSLTITLD